MSELRNKFGKALSTLLYSWGGDTPAEAMWTLHELLKFWWDLKSLPGEPRQFTDYLEEDGEEEEFMNYLHEYFPEEFDKYQAP
jgi:hypothetical protein